MSIDANPMAILATRAKLLWDVDRDQVRLKLDEVLEAAAACLGRANLSPVAAVTYQLPLFHAHVLKESTNWDAFKTGFDPNTLLPPEAYSLIPRDFISPKPLLRVLAVRYAIEGIVVDPGIRDLMTLALANTIVSTAGNVGFGPEVYRLPPREDADVLNAFAATVARMIDNLQTVVADRQRPFPVAHVSRDDARTMTSLEGGPPVGVVITSPPYPNEKDYTRSTRLESVLLGLVRSKQDLRAVKCGLLRSNTRNVFVSDDDERFIQDIPSVMRVAEEIESRRLQLGKTSGFERLYHRVTRLYFGGMFRNLAALSSKLRPGARCAYVVGDQMSYFRVHIRTAQLLADVAMKAGYRVEGIELWRTRRSTTTGQDLDENVLILKYPH